MDNNKNLKKQNKVLKEKSKNIEKIVRRNTNLNNTDKITFVI